MIDWLIDWFLWHTSPNDWKFFNGIFGKNSALQITEMHWLDLEEMLPKSELTGWSWRPLPREQVAILAVQLCYFHKLSYSEWRVRGERVVKWHCRLLSLVWRRCCCCCCSHRRVSRSGLYKCQTSIITFCHSSPIHCYFGYGFSFRS